MNTEEKYVGSVIFYKRVIKTAVAMAVLVPVGACMILLLINVGLHAAEHRAQQRIAQTRMEIEEAEKQIEENEQAWKALVTADMEAEEPSQLPWYLLLVNELHPLAKDFEVKLSKVSGGRLVDERIAEPLEEMFAAMRNEGMQPMVCSGYRSLRKQEALFEEGMAKNLAKGLSHEAAYYKTKTRQAVPGASEHHTGLAVDIVGKSHQSLNAAQANTKEAKWLEAHCAEYGFILRYPKDCMELTGREYESWHFRYVGKEAASDIMKNGITLEEYIDKIGES